MTSQEYNRTKLIQAIRETLDADQIKDVAEHGADAGWPGFTYYSDTCAFYEAHKEAIWDMLSNDADDQGTSIMALIASFGGARDVGSADQLENLLAWYALENVCRAEQDQEN